MIERDKKDRDSIRREAAGLRDAGLALQPLDFTEKRRVVMALCHRFGIDPTKLAWNANGTTP